ncbi:MULTISPECIES: hypothetical protein [Deinococcus]|uniref:Outer membrane protein beta-barrel domain-containing protein n=1 Tax=Deinococcus cavernae TaxID=2320857 RepID=A0A418VAX8_9DEIO|nr:MULTISPECIES: hypothetical protein [Deinococcus]RJF73284.1 hypothetical protein D3875_18720 [Deinococcus cavernae]
MKKTLLGFLALCTVTTASAANYVGGSIGTGGSIHYQQDRSATSAMRYSLDLAATGLSFNNLRVGGSADYLMNIPGQAPSALTPYYGAGLGAYVSLGAGTGVGLYPHALLGAKYNVSAPLSIFGEVNAGPYFNLGSATFFSFGWGARLGLNYQLNN